MEELKQAKDAFIRAIVASSDLPGINEINLATAAVALIKAERLAPGSKDTVLMKQVFELLRRPDVYEAARSMIDGIQP